MINATWTYVKSHWWLVLLGLLVVPVLVFRNTHTRTVADAPESTSTMVGDIDPNIADLKIIVSRDDTLIEYQDKTRISADGIGITTATLADYKKTPDSIKVTDLKDDDFPVVAFFNASCFDASGTPLIIRRAKDGSKAWPRGDVKLPKRLRAAIPLSSGNWSCYTWEKGGATTRIVVTDEDWHKNYLGAAAPAPAPTEKEDPAKEYSKKKPIKVKPAPEKTEKPEKEVPEKAAPEKKQGLRGHIYKIGGKPALVPLAVPVYVFKGRIQPSPIMAQRHANPKDERIVGKTKSDVEGKYSIPLDPGEYTMVIEIADFLFGNAYKQDTWPSIKVAEGKWTDYDFRKGN